MLVAAAKKKEEAKNAVEDVSLVAGTQQNFSNLYSLDIYGWTPDSHFWGWVPYLDSCNNDGIWQLWHPYQNIDRKLWKGRHDILRNDTQHDDFQHNDTQHKRPIIDTQHKWHSA